MKSLFPFRLFASAPEDSEVLPSALLDPAAQAFPAPNPLPSVTDSTPTLFTDSEEDSQPQSALLKTIGWISAGMGALALGVIVGRELRIRYKFNRRTPYDFYEHAGDEHDLEFGVGI
ncbi:hypothetical protein [Granulicella sibirica]|nr:hypothetical protein [Granulicella sibirica]